MDEKRKLLFDKISNAGIVLVGYEFLFMLYIILNTASKTIAPNVGIILFVGDVIAIILTVWLFCAVLYDIYTKL
ncbi:hypothetical protein J422_04605 [Methanocaldococcus villosus KIN24-T80]|uniref:Uncharacterized protein n=1 Tax=Methanocaldococcus villosus KIN24-T80 TaxID=1069083 RepID=N6VSA8_9EURY|nr:hypothetical protein [Methanocaldococcus villosus]ENN96036.1 hypothetical protein J422_04605 [Methanocaldococcus villosus KIN24-T80]